ncbi:hypothetical protein [Mycobacteroides saopaulense]|uniref:Beta-xylosidase n=1 Tax=Mycobacteroides saopaulense TaxID=1578165 RepID=A0ABX3C2B8_9MYCO|nr:hypothetical protein [Mycobacteroides saopaulense]OHT84964.1 hypothetical protein BKG68_14020 [Mycobacteroides saopaulense]OHU11117.1 hypothetical protein BKG73_07060 [Mycobacteroides saopaulense]
MAINFDRVAIQVIAGAGIGVAAVVLSPCATAAPAIGGQYAIDDGASGSGKGALVGAPAAGAAPVAGVPILPGPVAAPVVPAAPIVPAAPVVPAAPIVPAAPVVPAAPAVVPAAAPLDGGIAAGPVGGKGAPVGSTVPGAPTPGVPTPAGPQD